MANKFEDLKGKKINSWEVLERQIHPKGIVGWLCKCKCGTEKILSNSHVKRAKSCGCDYYEDITGQRFGRWNVIKRAETLRITNGKNKGQSLGSSWLCKCNCGEERIITKGSLKSGTTTSCGCIQKVSAKKRIETTIFHSYKNAAEKKGVEFNLSKKDLANLIFENCFYCGSLPGQKWKIVSKRIHLGKFMFYNGIDRIDSNIGYSNENCRTCCKNCNYMKNSLTQNEFYDHVRKIVNHLKLV